MWAWQTFLYVTQPDAGQEDPRFLYYQTPDEVFGDDAAPRFSKRVKQRSNTLVLAPRLTKEMGHRSLQEFMQADSKGVLVDRHGHIVYYAQHINKLFVDFIDQNHFRNVKNIGSGAPGLKFPTGCLELKSSWKILASDDNRDEFYVTKARVAVLKMVNGVLTIDPYQTVERDVALVGLHVVGVIDGHPEFVWGTFEHIRNAPDPKALNNDGAMANPNQPVSNNDYHVLCEEHTREGLQQEATPAVRQRDGADFQARHSSLPPVSVRWGPGGGSRDYDTE